MLATKPKKKKPSVVKIDESITRECAMCGKEFHPKKNGSGLISKYCSVECARKRAGMWRVNPARKFP
jgi:hypothetical protein